MKIYLETERLVLREFTQDDVDILVALDSDPDVLRFINGGTPSPRELIENTILPRFLKLYGRYENSGYWAAIEKASGEFVGWFELCPDDGRDTREFALGYRLRKKSWRMGYGTEGARALIAKAFTQLAARRVFACTYSENTASRRVMEKSGMKLARSYRMTPEELAGATTYLPTDVIWPGLDVEYDVGRTEWELATGLKA